MTEIHSQSTRQEGSKHISFQANVRHKLSIRRQLKQAHETKQVIVTESRQYIALRQCFDCRGKQTLKYHLKKSWRCAYTPQAAHCSLF